MSRKMYRLLSVLGLLLCCTQLSAQESSTGFENGNNQYLMRESTMSDVNVSPKSKPVTWGAELGAAIDMGGNDYSSFDVDVFGGYRSQLIKCLGVGIGYHHSFSSSRYSIPIYVIFRSNLSRKKSLFFVDLRAGYSTNRVQEGMVQGGFYGSAGVGINLAVSKRFGSHILLGYNYYQLSPYTTPTSAHNETGCHLVGVRLGISF